MTMQMVKTFGFIFLFLLTFLLTPSPVLAGGGPVSFMSFPLRPFDETKAYILQVDIYSNQPCSELKPTVTFGDTVDGDAITPFTPPDDGTYFTQHWNTGQPNFVWKELCTTYFKAKSGSASQRTAIVNVTVDGVNEKRDTTVSYGNDEWSKQLQGFGRVNDYDNTPAVDVINEKPYYEFKREIALQWQKIAWAGKYSVFASQIEENGTDSPYTLLDTTSDTHTTIILPKDNDFHLVVIPCHPDELCSTYTPGENTYPGLLERMRTGTKTAVSTPQKTSSSITPTLVPKNKDTETVDALNKKVAALENKLDESNKKQNVLEQRIQDLVNFIKSLFPSFK